MAYQGNIHKYWTIKESLVGRRPSVITEPESAFLCRKLPICRQQASGATGNESRGAQRTTVRLVALLISNDPFETTTISLADHTAGELSMASRLLCRWTSVTWMERH